MKGWEQWTNGSIERDMKDLEIAHLYFEGQRTNMFEVRLTGISRVAENFLPILFSTNHTVCMSNLTGIFG